MKLCVMKQMGIVIVSEKKQSTVMLKDHRKVIYYQRQCMDGMAKFPAPHPSSFMKEQCVLPPNWGVITGTLAFVNFSRPHFSGSVHSQISSRMSTLLVI